LTEPARPREKTSWRDALLRVLKAWNRHQIPKILAAVVVIWIVTGTALHFAEGGTTPAYETWRESLWNVWVTLFSGRRSAQTVVGRLMCPPCLSSVSPGGLVHASVASILIERH
jgi:hypothetical protein